MYMQQVLLITVWKFLIVDSMKLMLSDLDEYMSLKDIRS